MLMRIFIVCFAIIWSAMCFSACREYSAYFDLCKCKLHIKLRSELLSRIFIADSIKSWSGGHRVEVSPWDEHKLLLLGGIAHIIVDPICLFMIYCSIQYALFPSEETWHVAFNTTENLTLTLGVFIVLKTINNCKVR